MMDIALKGNEVFRKFTLMLINGTVSALSSTGAFEQDTRHDRKQYGG